MFSEGKQTTRAPAIRQGLSKATISTFSCLGDSGKKWCGNKFLFRFTKHN